MRVGRIETIVCACSLVACGSPPSPAGEADTTSGADEVESSVSASESASVGTSSSEDTSATDVGSESSESGQLFDLAPQPDAGASEGCQAIDFLFVIDDSSSMSEHQQNLAANVPNFVAGLEATLDAVDSIHVGVVASDPYSYNPPACIQLGALVTRTVGGGPDSSNMDCGPYAEGFNYMTGTDDLGASFDCAARLGTLGNGFERPMEALVEALDGDLAGLGGCNAGFLRDDALLVVIVITDEYDGPGDPEAMNPARDPPTSSGDPQSWYDAVVAAKGGVPENAAALVIANYDDGPCPPVDMGHDGVNLVDWVDLFGDHGVLGGICEPDYGPMLEDATQIVLSACADFVPVG